MTALRMIGYWQEPCNPTDYPHPRDFVQPGWEATLKARIVHYLRSGQIYRGFWDYADCRFDDGRPPQDMGSHELTDGVYIWPEGLVVYVEDYDVCLPEEFVEHMKNQQFVMPTDMPKYPGSKWKTIDYEFWKNWTKDYLRNNELAPHINAVQLSGGSPVEFKVP